MYIKAGIAKLFNVICLVFAVWALAGSVAGCQKCDDGQGSKEAESKSPTRPIQAAASRPDDAPTTNVVTSDQMPGRPRHIVSLAPNITEILFEIGAGDRLEAVTRFCDYPPEVEQLPKIGGVIDPDLEAIIAHEPDLVIGVTSGAGAEIREQLEQAGVSYAFAEMDDIEETYAGILHIGAWIGEDRRAREVVDRMQRSIAEISVDPPDDERPSVVFVYGRKPLTLAGPDTFGHELVVRAGGRNPMAGAETKYPKVDLEKVLELDPDHIIDASMGGSVDDDFWQQYDGLDAVESGNVHRLENAALLRPGPRLVEGLRRIKEVIQGDSSASPSEP
jgi:iron complex transport system substrate-binding protein